MAIELNGTTGITTPDVNSDGLTVDSTTLVVDEANNRVGIGTSSPSTKLHLETGSGDLITTMAGASRTWQLRNQADGNLGLYDSTAAAWRTFWDTSGNVGIGTSSPSVRLNVTDSSDGGNSGTIRMGSDGTYYGQQQFRYNSSEYRIGVYPSGNMTFYTKGSESARIDSNGQLLVGTTSNPGGGTSVVAFSGLDVMNVNNTASGTGSVTSVYFKRNATTTGTITVTGSSTAYNTSSDYRLKENVVGVTGASARVQQLNPVRFNFIADPDTTVDGFLAHEVQDVVPEAITGAKDEVDAEGNPEYQGIDQSKLVPLLTAALQEALTKIETLEARVAALESA